MKTLALVISLSIALLTACTGAVESNLPKSSVQESLPSGEEDRQTARPIITIDISMYMLVSDTAPVFSTRRSEDDLREILSGMNDIWSQADIRFDLGNVSRVEVPPDVLSGMGRGDLRAFVLAIGDGVQVTEPSTLNAFYLRSVGGPNGINPFSSRMFFVIDEPSVHDRRVSSHEIGHILGLHHDLRDAGTLMFSGTNGMEISEDEATVARYVANGILNGIR